jgi:hypothetical protein
MPQGPDDEMVEIDADCFAETSLAWGIVIVPLGSEKETQVWLPKSISQRKSDTRWEVPLWLAEKHKMV